VSVPVLSTTSVSTFSQQLERLGVLDEHAFPRTAADADHDRHRRRQPERTRTRDDEHRHGDEQRMRERGAGPTIAQTTKAATAIAMTASTNQPDTWSASFWIGARERLRFGDELDDAREQRVGAHAIRAHHERTGPVDGPARHPAADRLLRPGSARP
jgi:hypothetical protein